MAADFAWQGRLKLEGGADGCGGLGKRAVLDAILDAVENTQGPRLARLRLELMCLFREKHSGGELHDHVALLACRCFRFLPIKRRLLQDYGLASHW